MVKRMQGVSAHIVTLKPDRWIYNNTCKFYLSNRNCARRPKTECTGASYCPMYEEKKARKKVVPVEETKSKVDPMMLENHKRRIKREKKKQVESNKGYKGHLRIGSLINHKTLGLGEIVSNDGYSMEVDFDGEIKSLNIAFVLDKNLIEIA